MLDSAREFTFPVNADPTQSLSLRDRLIDSFDQCLRTVAPGAKTARRPSPAENLTAPQLDARQRRHSAGLIRVNHTGEVCAQALYLGQGLAIRNQELKRSFYDAAAEERDHLLWCAERLQQLESRPSLLNPAWFVGSATIGLVASAFSDASNLGFVEETERQVCAHLDRHLAVLSQQDAPSRAIVIAMRADEERHAADAKRLGAKSLPRPMRRIMALQARVMTTLAYWI